MTSDPAALLALCPTPEALAACAPPDAAALSDAALLAVHQPLPLVRRSAAGDEPADERAALDALLGEPGVVWLVGPPASGKTHLLRWLGLHAGDRRVVTASGADLAAVVEGLAAEVAGPPPPAPVAPDEKAAREHLLEAFRDALQERTAAARAACDAAAERGERPPADERAVAETHGDGLVALLAGPTRDALFRDTPRRKSVFKALVRRVTTGVAEPDRERFEPADFEFTDVNSARLADPKAQRYVAKLKTNLQGERAAAAALMNAARDAALDRFPAPAAAEPADPPARLRDALTRDGREVVLLVDDYTPPAEGEPDLLGALADGRGPVRAAVAVADAVRGRAGFAFALGEGAALPEAVAELVGAYLSAARPAPAEADRAAVAAFGVSPHGHQLFPLGRDALARLAGADGRLVPGRVVRDLPAALAEARAAFARGELPPELAPAPAPVAAVPETPPAEPAPVEQEAVATVPPPAAPVEVDTTSGALAVLLGRLPVPPPDDVVRFLTAACTTGATLDLLTPGVVEWLRAHDQLGAFRVRAG